MSNFKLKSRKKNIVTNATGLLLLLFGCLVGLFCTSWLKGQSQKHANSTLGSSFTFQWTGMNQVNQAVFWDTNTKSGSHQLVTLGFASIEKSKSIFLSHVPVIIEFDICCSFYGSHYALLRLTFVQNMISHSSKDYCQFSCQSSWTFFRKDSLLVWYEIYNGKCHSIKSINTRN